jgi:hypothetical protein
MAWLLIGLVLVTVALWAVGWALAHYGVVLLVATAVCAWYFLRSGRHG